MKTYQTSAVAKIIGIHPNTVRLYEKYKLIPKPQRRKNGYRIFTDFHVEQLRLARIALKIEVLQNGLRKTAIDIIKISASGDFDNAIYLTNKYLQQIKIEQQHAEEAITIVKKIMSGEEGSEESKKVYLRHEAAEYLQITTDTIRNWEMNGLLTVKRKQNGYRIYSNEDIKRLKIIRSLRCANYSLASILRLLGALSLDPNVNIRDVINTPEKGDNIISACDHLLTSLFETGQKAEELLEKLQSMKQQFN
jgi:DNA-binding transcriptional MerR regulator